MEFFSLDDPSDQSNSTNCKGIVMSSTTTQLPKLYCIEKDSKVLFAKAEAYKWAYTRLVEASKGLGVDSLIADINSQVITHVKTALD